MSLSFNRSRWSLSLIYCYSVYYYSVLCYYIFCFLFLFPSFLIDYLSPVSYCHFSIGVITNPDDYSVETVNALKEFLDTRPGVSELRPGKWGVGICRDIWLVMWVRFMRINVICGLVFVWLYVCVYLSVSMRAWLCFFRFFTWDFWVKTR